MQMIGDYKESNSYRRFIHMAFCLMIVLSGLSIRYNSFSESSFSETTLAPAGAMAFCLLIFTIFRLVSSGRKLLRSITHRIAWNTIKTSAKFLVPVLLSVYIIFYFLSHTITIENTNLVYEINFGSGNFVLFGIIFTIYYMVGLVLQTTQKVNHVQDG